MIKAEIIEGSPSEIMRKLSDDMVEVLQAAGIQPSGVHALAMCHCLVAMIRAGQDCKGEQGVGLMPSFRMLLGVLTHGLSGVAWGAEEKEQFNDEFCRIIESLGGHKLKPGEARASTMPMVMSPKMGSC